MLNFVLIRDNPRFATEIQSIVESSTSEKSKKFAPNQFWGGYRTHILQNKAASPQVVLASNSVRGEFSVFRGRFCHLGGSAKPAVACLHSTVINRSAIRNAGRSGLSVWFNDLGPFGARGEVPMKSRREPSFQGTAWDVF